MNNGQSQRTGLEIAIVGMSARFPGAENIEQFWQNLCEGSEGVHLFSDSELIQSGIEPALLNNPQYIKAKGFLKDGDKFDNGFFDFSPMQAKVMDPQLRILHECCWHALENAGYNPHAYSGSIGLFTGASCNLPWVSGFLDKENLPDEIYNLLNLNDLGSFATLISYKLNLKGPSLSLQTACSTSLVAVHLAVQSLLNGECDMALAGGVSLTYPLRSGYLIQEGMIYSADGHCRAFDAKADGTICGNGVGMLLLKPLDNALKDRDSIYAVIKGSAINNDGDRKVGYTAPSIKGQAEVIRTALLTAEVEPNSISYIEAHGTATRLGDPVEVAALKQAFGKRPPTACALGSVKTNIGHLDVAAGIAGLIKTVLCLKHQQLVPSLHFEAPNPDIDFASTPFQVSVKTAPWLASAYPRRAGVSSFGIGGTNAHVILEEFNTDEEIAIEERCELFTLSGHTEAAFRRNLNNLIHFLKLSSDISIADVAFTLNTSKRALPYRGYLVCKSKAEAIDKLTEMAQEKEIPCVNLREVSQKEKSLLSPQEIESRKESYLEKIGVAWLTGVDLDWSQFYAGRSLRHIPLPEYSFEKSFFPVDEVLIAHRSYKEQKAGYPKAVKDWYYLPHWRREYHPHPSMLPEERRTWLFIERGTTWEKTFKDFLIGRGQTIISARVGHTWEQITESQYVIRPESKDDMVRLLTALKHDQRFPQIIVHTLNIDADGQSSKHLDWADTLLVDQKLDEGFFSLIWLAQAIGEEDRGDVCLSILTNEVMDVTGAEKLDVVAAASLGPAKILPYEYEHIQCCWLDVQREELQTGTVVFGQIFEECRRSLKDTAKVRQVALRNGFSWVQEYQSASLDERPVPLKEGGVYLITGGLGGIGFSLAQYLGYHFKAKLALINRSALEEKNDQKQKDVLKASCMELEQAGAQVMIFKADVADRAAMSKAIQTIQEKWGRINGVFHCAGIAEGELTHTRTKESILSTLAPKMKGTLVLHALLKNEPPDFMVLFSSLGNILYPRKVGQLAYNSANEFLDAFAYYSTRQSGSLTLSIGYDDWAEVGMSVRSNERWKEMLTQLKDEQLRNFIQTLISTPIIKPEEGIQALKTSLSTHYPRVVVTPFDLTGQIREAFAGENILHQIFHLEQNGSHQPAGQRSDRPKSPDEIRQVLKAILEEQLGLVLTGYDEDYYEIGGDSFEAISILREIEKHLGAKVNVSDFFSHPTINTLADLILNTQLASTEQNAIRPAPPSDVYPLSSGQKRLFILQQLDPDNLAYNLPFFVRLEGKIEQEKIRDVFRNLIEQQDLLRTSFRLKEGEPVQVIHSTVAFDIEMIDLNEDELPHMVKGFIRPFQLNAAPLFRVALAHIDETHSLLMTDMHHIIADGMSRDILLEDFLQLYRGERLPKAEIQFKDYVVWLQSNYMQTKREAQRAFWLNQYKEPVPPLQLPIDFKRPAVQSFEGASIFFELEAREVNQLRELAKKEEATLYMVLLSAYLILLAGLSGQEDIIVGTPTMGRRHPGTERMFGMLVNMITLHNKPEGNKPYRTFLKEIKENALVAFENQDYPFEELVDQLNLERDVSRNPLFDVVFALQNMEAVQAEIPGLRLTPYQHENRAALFDLLLMGEEEDQRIRFTLEYAAKLFQKETVERFMVYFRHILHTLMRDPDLLLKDIALLPEAEKNWLLYEYNAARVPYPQEKTIQQLFEEQVCCTPQAPAVVYSSQVITYAQLNGRANYLAQTLRAKGVKPATTVALLMEHSPDVIIGMLGVLKAGGAYVPIDPALPEARIRHMLTDCKADWVITQPSLADRFSFLEELDLEILHLEPERTEPINPDPISGPEDPVYVIYTSGSTGQPKGCLLTQRGLVNYICWAKKVYLGEEKLHFPLYTSISFDLTVTSIYTPLISGSTVFVYRGLENENILERIIQDNQVQVIKLTPTHLQLLSLIDCTETQVRKLIVGGENLKTETARSAAEAFGRDIEIYNEYGPTETVVGCMLHRYRPDEDSQAAVPIGVPADNVQIYILDKYLRPTPSGVKGELFISGDGVGQGYLNRPEMTSQSFLENPFVKGTRMYRTGDAAVFLKNGQILFLGRIDHQVKIRGHRIELEEIENALLRFQRGRPAQRQQIQQGLRLPASRVKRCSRCLISDKYPQVQFDEQGVCHICRDFDKHEPHIRQYFGQEKNFIELTQRLRLTNTSRFDCVLLYSGGKDSTYVLYKLIDLGFKVLAFTFDNGYISTAAIENIKQTTSVLGVEHVVLQAEKMNQVFVESLDTAHTVCHGCWNAINGLGTRLAYENGINLVVSGLSRGQIFEMRLESLFMMGIYETAELEDKILSFRKRFHSSQNRFARMLDATLPEEIIETIQYVDYYRYAEVSEDEINRYLTEKGWKKPDDTGFCSSNCLINDIGIYVHLQQAGYHFYEHQLSWDCRLDVLSREEGLQKIELDPNTQQVERILDEIGYFETPIIREAVVIPKEDKNGDKYLCAYYEANERLAEEVLKAHLQADLPDYMIPAFFVHLDTIPLAKNGKVDRNALQDPTVSHPTPIAAPRNQIEEALVHIWSKVLAREEVGITDNFFDLGGNSLKIIQMLSLARKELNLREDLRVIDLFKFPTIEAVARFLSSDEEVRTTTADQADALSIMEETLRLWEND